MFLLSLLLLLLSIFFSGIFWKCSHFFLYLPYGLPGEFVEITTEETSGFASALCHKEFSDLNVRLLNNMDLECNKQFPLSHYNWILISIPLIFGNRFTQPSPYAFSARSNLVSNESCDVTKRESPRTHLFPDLARTTEQEKTPGNKAEFHRLVLVETVA